MNLIKKIGQLKYPKEFRINSLDITVTDEIVIRLEGLMSSLLNNKRSYSNKNNDEIIDKTFFIEVAVGIWRLEKKVIEPKSKQPFDEMKKIYRHIESIRDALKKEGIEIIDHDEQPFDSGLSLKVLAFQPAQGIEKEIVLETIKPSVYMKSERIQMGEVIVGTPID